MEVLLHYIVAGVRKSLISFYYMIPISFHLFFDYACLFNFSLYPNANNLIKAFIKAREIIAD